MGFRFRRTIKLLPGVTLNLNKTGVSVSAGVRGAKVTVGKNGVRQTVGLPGTGLSHTTYTKYGNNSAPRVSSYAPSSGQSQTNISSPGAIIVIGLFLLIIFAVTKPLLIPVLVVFLVIYFVWKKNNTPDSVFATHREENQMESATAESAISMVQLVNESLKMANESEHYETRIAKTKVVKDTIAKLKEISHSNPEISLTSLEAVERSIEAVERETREKYTSSLV